MDPTVIEDPVLKQRLRFTRSTDEGGGEVLHVDLWVEPGGGVTPHIHPGIEERFEVLEGTPSFLAGREWRTASPGDTVAVLPGVRHAYRNDGDTAAHVVCHVRPPSSLQAFLEEVAAMSRAGMISSRGLPKGFGALLEAAALARRHREMVVLLFPPMPPPWVQRLLFPLLAPFGERRRGATAQA